ncbi:MAG TPA: MBL fold metallo-hydrolase [Pseudonocardiaceae bacterium]|jgi:glyoxylase-like metal-dependent hydrolase (beta-lactamase superfamily II)
MISRLVTSGTFSLDGGTWEVDNNVWLIGDEREVIVVDAAHDADAIAAAVGDRRVLSILCTHAHDDHVSAAPELSRKLDAPVLLHPAEHVLWRLAHPDIPPPEAELADGDTVHVAGTTLQVLHTPGHSPGSSCLYAPELNTLFSGDTLFQGGPGATGRSYSDFDEIIASIQTRLLTLPADTEVRTGHGDSTTIGQEAEHVGEWLARGH